ncbi:transcriptional regulator [Solibacillus cecembensis]|uniref:transcriptional regulator n=1 Tax=Solibacillus cecembensis TaxID=459347 RepID=UPI003D00DE2C
MQEQLIKAMQRNQLVDMMYVSKTGEISKRRVKIIKMMGDKFQAFCFTKQAKRTFTVDNVLATVPVAHKEGWVV